MPTPSKVGRASCSKVPGLNRTPEPGCFLSQSTESTGLVMEKDHCPKASDGGAFLRVTVLATGSIPDISRKISTVTVCSTTPSVSSSSNIPIS